MKLPRRLRQLVGQLRSGDIEAAFRALRALHDSGWLYDGTLNALDLRGADLAGLDLSNAQLVGVNLAGANLAGANCARIDLSLADLEGANLDGTTLKGAALQEINLENASLQSAVLTEANVAGGFLRGARMNAARLNRTDFTGCSLVEARLNGARLIDTNLADADLTDATLIGARIMRSLFVRTNLLRTDFSHASSTRNVFSDVDLSKATGLDTVHHTGPSELSLGTLTASKGPMAEFFLRGCGAPERVFARRRTVEPCSAFISFSYHDRAFARRLYDGLQQRGIRCWLDEKAAEPEDDDIYREVSQGLRKPEKLVLCASRPSLTSRWIDNELDIVFEQERQLSRELGEAVYLVLTLDVDGYLQSPRYKSDKKPILRQRLIADFQEWDEDETVLERGIERVTAVLEAANQPRRKRRAKARRQGA